MLFRACAPASTQIVEAPTIGRGGAAPSRTCYARGMSKTEDTTRGMVPPLAHIHASARRRKSAFVTLCALMLLGLGAARCTTGARGQHCTNDAQCPDADRGHAYCFQSHCVECMTNAACGAHHRCAAGECVEI
jgi:hypothetical protein